MGQISVICQKLQQLENQIKDITDVMGLKEHHASLMERVAYLEKDMGDSIEKHQRMLAEMHDKHNDAMSKHASIPERVAYLEKEVGDSADKHSAVLQELKAHGQFKQDLESHHGTVEQRLSYIEKEVGDSFDKHAKQMEEFKKAHQDHAKHIDDLRGQDLTV